jgi:alpha-mannosidase
MTVLAAFSRAIPSGAKIAAGLSGPVATSAVVRSSARMCPALEQEIILYDDLKRIDIVNRLDKQETYDPEAVYFAFPFAVKDGAFRFEIADADMAPDTEQLPRTTRDWHTVQNWVEIANGDISVVWSPVEAPLIELGGINTGKWLQKMDLSRTSIYSYAMNNYWMTNFKAAQGGSVAFRYSVAGRPGGPDRVASSRFGWEVHCPLAAAWVPAGNPGGMDRPAASFFSVEKANVIIQAVKRAEDGNGIVLRLREIAGRGVETRVTSPFLDLGLKASLASLTEDEGDPIEVKNGGFTVDLKPFGIVTILIRPGK